MKIEETLELDKDLVAMSKSLGTRCKRMALFGSTARFGLKAASDIDLAIFMENPSIEYVKEKLAIYN